VGNDEDERGGNEAGVAWDGSCDGLSTRARDGPWTAEPVGARGAIVGGVERDDFLPIGAEVLLAATAFTWVSVFLGPGAITTATVDFAYCLCGFIVLRE
jgi:hypothetical protein